MLSRRAFIHTSASSFVVVSNPTRLFKSDPSSPSVANTGVTLGLTMAEVQSRWGATLRKGKITPHSLVSNNMRGYFDFLHVEEFDHQGPCYEVRLYARETEGVAIGRFEPDNFQQVTLGMLPSDFKITSITDAEAQMSGDTFVHSIVGTSHWLGSRMTQYAETVHNESLHEHFHQGLIDIRTQPHTHGRDQYGFDKVVIRIGDQSEQIRW